MIRSFNANAKLIPAKIIISLVTVLLLLKPRSVADAIILGVSVYGMLAFTGIVSTVFSSMIPTILLIVLYLIAMLGSFVPDVIKIFMLVIPPIIGIIIDSRRSVFFIKNRGISQSENEDVIGRSVADTKALHRLLTEWEDVARQLDANEQKEVNGFWIIYKAIFEEEEKILAAIDEAGTVDRSELPEVLGRAERIAQRNIEVIHTTSKNATKHLNKAKMAYKKKYGKKYIHDASESREQNTNNNTYNNTNNRQSDSSVKQDEFKPEFFSGCDSEESLTKRYRALVKIYHPDQGNGSSEEFNKIQREYEILKKQYT